MINQKRGISKTLSWFVAVIAVFFIMILFVAGSSALAARKSANEIQISLGNIYFPLKSFLDSPVEGREGVFIRDLISSEPEDNPRDFELFRKLALDFMVVNYHPHRDSLKTWLRIYDFEETIGKMPYKDPSAFSKKPLKYIHYEIFTGAENSRKNPCDPLGDGSFGIVYLLNKKVVLCVEEK
tara:strand:- start:34 stop:579 length:546 start_codon:yes stop_codon:yes gene_type:complete